MCVESNLPQINCTSNQLHKTENVDYSLLSYEMQYLENTMSTMRRIAKFHFIKQCENCF